MSERISRFTNDARQIFARAQEQAKRYKQHEIGAEHLLIALLEDKNSDAAQVIASMGVDPQQVGKLVAGEGDGKPAQPAGELELSQEVKDLIQIAILEAQRKNYAYVGTKELLLALVQKESSAAFAVLNQAGVQPATFRQAVRETLADDSAGAGV